jgi:hypothetical protein
MKYLVFVFAFLFSAFSFADNSEHFAQLILKALNSKPQLWIEPITSEDIQVKGGAGRVDVNKKSKFSYYVHIEEPNNKDSRILLIPMATSRYTPTYYQSDDWWDAHKEEIEAAKREGKPAPRQDMNEVAAWLTEMKLSTNPFVFEISAGGAVQKQLPLQDFLLQFYRKNFYRKGFVRLYRGGEKLTETDDWLSGKRPRGARYWTPTAAYAWRYGRKNRNFLTDLIAGRAPLYVFDVPIAEFESMVNRRWQRLVLGTELTKNAHTSFDQSGAFLDHLAGNSDFMGIGSIGLEFEIRSNSKGANLMLEHFQRPISVEELAADRISVLEKTLERMKRWSPEKSEELEASYSKRIHQVKLESQIMVGIRDRAPQSALRPFIEQLPSYSFEIANIDGINFKQFATEELQKLPLVAEVRTEASPAEKISAAKVAGRSLVRSCHALLMSLQ